jgi:hypothetical protein
MALENGLQLSGLALNDATVCPFPCSGGSRQERHPRIRSPAAVFELEARRPWCSSLGSIPVRGQRDRLLAWAAPFDSRSWAVEGAISHGALSAQQ